MNNKQQKFDKQHKDGRKFKYLCIHSCQGKANTFWLITILNISPSPVQHTTKVIHKV